MVPDSRCTPVPHPGSTREKRPAAGQGGVRVAARTNLLRFAASLGNGRGCPGAGSQLQGNTCNLPWVGGSGLSPGKTPHPCSQRPLPLQRRGVH